MWCTRWFLPLIILPLPTAPPFFLILFLVSLTLHARPCFYCMVLLTALFASSCYWQPLPLDAQLTHPTPGAATFADALNITSVPAAFVNGSVATIQLFDRCWCAVGSGLFEPFDVAKWELRSIERARSAILPPPSLVTVPPTETATADSTGDTVGTQKKPSRLAFLKRWQNVVWPTTDPSPLPAPQTTTPAPPPAAAETPPPLPFLRREYDLHPHGIGLTFDFRWGRVHAPQVANGQASH